MGWEKECEETGENKIVEREGRGAEGTKREGKKRRWKETGTLKLNATKFKCSQYLAEEGSGEITTLNGHATKQSFLICFLQNVFFDRLLTHQTVAIQTQIKTEMKILSEIASSPTRHKLGNFRDFFPANNSASY